LNKIRASS